MICHRHGREKPDLIDFSPRGLESGLCAEDMPGASDITQG